MQVTYRTLKPQHLNKHYSDTILPLQAKLKAVGFCQGEGKDKNKVETPQLTIISLFPLSRELRPLSTMTSLAKLGHSSTPGTVSSLCCFTGPRHSIPSHPIPSSYKTPTVPFLFYTSITLTFKSTSTILTPSTKNPTHIPPSTINLITPHSSHGSRRSTTDQVPLQGQGLRLHHFC
jgi:hypothetical protein